MDRTMRAVVYQGPYDVAIEEVDDPEIEHPNDVVIDITTSCICGSDLHMYEGEPRPRRESCSATRIWGS